jgi:hypothetical protein
VALRDLGLADPPEPAGRRDRELRGEQRRERVLLGDLDPRALADERVEAFGPRRSRRAASR